MATRLLGGAPAGDLLSVAREQDGFVLVGVAGRRCALPVGRVVEIHPAVRPTPLPGAPAVVLGVVNRRGTIIPMIDTRAHLGLPSRPPLLSDCLAVVDAGGRTVALLADSAIDVVTITQHDIEVADGGAPPAVAVHGVIVLPDALAVVVDLDAFLSTQETVALDEAIAAAAASEAR